MRVLFSLVCVGIGYCVLLPLELFTNAVAGRGRPARALFHTIARNVINISSGNILPPLSYLHAWTNTDVSEPELTRHTSAERDEVLFMWNNERIHAM